MNHTAETTCRVEFAIENTPYRIVDDGRCRLLMVQGNDISAHSVMNMTAPDELGMPYTAAMMKRLAFKPAPKDVVLIGLDGGMQAKFLYKRMPDTRVVAIEIDPAIVDIARNYFSFPADDERLSVVTGDGGRYIGQHPASCDTSFADGYGGSLHQLDDALATTDFYHACHQALRENGLIALNMYCLEKNRLDAQVAALLKIFPTVLNLNIDKYQSILIVFKKMPNYDYATLTADAEKLEKRLGLHLPDLYVCSPPRMSTLRKKPNSDNNQANLTTRIAFTAAAAHAMQIVKLFHTLHFLSV